MENRIAKERNFWSSFAGRYDKFISKTLGNTYENLYENLTKDVEYSDKVLEIATGTGLVAFRICENVQFIDAIDISAEMIQIAKEKQKNKQVSNIKFDVGDSYNLDFEANSFDKVIASNVLHLLFEPEKALSEIKRVLKSNGKAILPTFCHGENFKSLFLSGFMSIFGFSARNKWSEKSFVKFVENSGFKIIKSKTLKGKIPLMYLVVEKV